MTPTTSCGLSLSVTDVPMTVSEAPNRRSHSPWLSTATAAPASSMSENVRPSRADTPSVRKNSPVTTSPSAVATSATSPMR